MNINLNIKDLRKMQYYLTKNQLCEMFSSIVDYVDEGKEYDFYNDKMQMIWDDIKPQLDKSIKSYNEWYKKEKEKRLDNAIKEFVSTDKKEYEYNDDSPY